MGFGQVVRALRTTAGLSLREVARDLSVSPTYLSRIETGKIPPPVEEKIHLLESRLGVPEGYLMGFTKRNPTLITKMLSNNSEAVHFLEAANQQGFTPEDFSLMTKFVSQGGKKGIVQLLKKELREKKNTDLSSYKTKAPSLLRKELVFPNVKAKDWLSLIRTVAGKISSVQPEIDADYISQALIQAEKGGRTTLDAGLAVPHAFIDGLTKKVTALVRIPEGVDLNEKEGSIVTIAIFILASEEMRATHVYDLARIARLFLLSGFHEKIMAAKDEQELLATFREGEQKTP